MACSDYAGYIDGDDYDEGGNDFGYSSYHDDYDDDGNDSDYDYDCDEGDGHGDDDGHADP